MVYERLLVAGDLFDSPKTHPAWLSLLSRGVVEILSAISGNHEMSSVSLWDQSILTASRIGRAVCHEPSVIAPGVAAIPYAPSTSQIDYLSRAMAHPNLRGHHETHDVCVAHVGVWDGAPPMIPNHSASSVGARDLITSMGANSISVMFVGDWHKSGVFSHDGKVIVQCGTTCPIDWSDSGPNNGFVYYLSLLHTIETHATKREYFATAIWREGIPGVPQFETVTFGPNAAAEIARICGEIRRNNRIPFIALAAAPQEIASARQLADTIEESVTPTIIAADAAASFDRAKNQLVNLGDLEAGVASYVANNVKPEIQSEVQSRLLEYIREARRAK
jgi:hypothetical protein